MMVSVRTKERLKHLGLFGFLGLAAVFAAPALGLSFWYATYLAASFILIPLPMLFTQIEPTKFNQRNIPQDINHPDFLPYFKMFRIACLMISIAIALPLIAYFQTGSALYSLMLFALPLIATKVEGSIYNKSKSSELIFNNSSSRQLNLDNADEAQFDRTLTALCQKMNIQAIPSVLYIELFDKVNENNFGDFKKDLEKAGFSKKSIDGKSNAELLDMARRRVTPNMLAANSILEGNRIMLFSSVFNHPEIKCTPQEIEALLAHELGHNVNRDSTRALLARGFQWVAIILSLSSFRLVGLGIAGLAHIAQVNFNKSIETKADLHSAEYVDSEGLISFFQKLKEYSNKLKLEERTLSDQPEQRSLFKKMTGYYSKWAGDHPSDKSRIALLRQDAQEQNIEPSRATVLPR